MNIFLDIDDVIFDWHEAYCKRFNAKKPKRWMAYNETIKTRLELLRKEKKFFIELSLREIDLAVYSLLVKFCLKSSISSGLIELTIEIFFEFK